MTVKQQPFKVGSNSLSCDYSEKSLCKAILSASYPIYALADSGLDELRADEIEASFSSGDEVSHIYVIDFEVLAPNKAKLIS